MIGQKATACCLSSALLIAADSAAVGCGGKSGTTASHEAPMTARLKQAVRDGESRAMFVDSPLYEAGLSGEEADAASAYINGHPDVSSYILLMALWQHAPASYARIADGAKAKVLCDALTKLPCVNDFGRLTPSESRDEEAARALLSVGKPALPWLQALLRNREEVGLYGSKYATVVVYG